MPDFSVVALFCEDVREEVGDTQTIVGALPDNLQVSSIPGMMPKLCVYLRMNFDPASRPRPFSAVLRFPDGTEVPFGNVDEDLITQASEQAVLKGNPIAGIKARSQLIAVTFKATGLISAVIKMDADEYVCGILNIKTVEP